MKKFLKAIIVLIAFHSSYSVAQEIEETLVITSAFIDTAEINNPLYVIDGDDIAESATTSLGDFIDEYLGISIADYGAAVGQPIIRGMSGPRVKILKNGMVNRDVSGLGVDHLNDLDLHDVQQVEIVKGPSSLLYANGTTGGIINVVDDCISALNYELPEINIGYETQSVNDGSSEFFNVKSMVAGFNVNFGYKNTEFGNYDIPNGAIMHEEEHHDEDDHDEEGHDEDEHEDEHDDHGGLQRAEYMQKDAKFNGYEFQFGRKIDLANGYLDLSFGRDAVNGKFSDGTKVSRVVPARNIYSVKYANNDAYELKVTLKDVAKQDDIGEDETVTSGFRMLDLKAMKTFDFAAGSELSVSVFANNILDEVARNHTSFVKNEVPLPGRNVGVRLKLNF